MQEIFHSTNGPAIYIFCQLDKNDLKKLAFIFSSSISEMEEKYKTFKDMAVMGRKLETKIFNRNHLYFESDIPSILKFVNSIQKPFNVLNREQELFMEKASRINDMCHYQRIERDVKKMKQGLFIGEKIEQDVLIVFSLIQKNRFQRLLFKMIKCFKDPKFVISLIPIPALSLALSRQPHFLILKRFLKLFGMDILKPIILQYLDEGIFFSDLFESIDRYTFNTEQLLDELYHKQIVLTNQQLLNMIKEGSKIIDLCDELLLHFPILSQENFNLCKRLKLISSLIHEICQIQ
jgi:hypothetical protein